MAVERLNLSDLKRKSPKDLVALAEELEIENASCRSGGVFDNYCRLGSCFSRPAPGKEKQACPEDTAE